MRLSSEVQLSKIYYSLIFYTYSTASPSHLKQLCNQISQSRQPVYSALQLGNHVTVMMSTVQNGLAHSKCICAFPSKGLYYTNSLYLQRQQRQISESCQRSGQQAFWNLVHTDRNSGSQWLIMKHIKGQVHIFLKSGAHMHSETVFAFCNDSSCSYRPLEDPFLMCIRCK